jgi:outer membrane protein assembly factor BamA
VRAAVVVIAWALIALAPAARADDVPPDAQPLVGFRVRGDSKLTERTAGWLAHVEIGQLVSPGQIPELEAALMSSELFDSVKVTFEPGPGGVLMVAQLHDKMSWIAAPTLFVLPNHWAVGAGYAESDLGGANKKMLLYAQLGNRQSMFLGTFLDPSIHGTHWQARFDIYLLHEIDDEYTNPPSDPRSFAVDRETTMTFLDGGMLLGYQLYWWLIADLRLRGAYLYFRDVHAEDAAKTPLPKPEPDGWDWSVQARITLDHRAHRFGVTWGPYAQLLVEPSVPGVTYSYQMTKLRAYYSWAFWGEHELELRTRFGIGRHLPFQDELTLGGVQDLRGYDLEQFRGDTLAMFRVEYSVPIAKWKFFAFRGIGFFDSGYVGFNFTDPSGMRDYLPGQHAGARWLRSDLGAGLRVYVSRVVLPLLGLDLAYGLEGHAPEVYFEVGLTDF